MSDERTGRISETPEPAKQAHGLADGSGAPNTPNERPDCSDSTDTGTDANRGVAKRADRTQAEAESPPPPVLAIAVTLGAPPSAEPHPAPPPAKIGKYEIVREIGRGGMGVVYQALDKQLNRQVALKMVLAAEFATPDALKRFNREAETIARLHHPNIVQIYEVGTHDQKPYFALEYLEGGTLWSAMQGKPLSPRAAASLTKTLADAVHHAHERGIIHRDLKPANVLLTAERPTGSMEEWTPLRIPKITDFGLAKLDPNFAGSQRSKADSKGLTRSGEMLGTPSYMAPEQIESKNSTIGRATDIYALGAILYELLTGRPPFSAPTPMETILQVLGRDPVPPTRLQPKTPRDLATICLKCLEKEPRKRYASGKSLAADLQRFLDGHSILAHPAGIVERTAKWAKRRPAVAALLLLVMLSIVGGFAGVSWQLHETAKARDEATLARDVAREEQAKTAHALDQAETTLYFGLIAQARLEWRTHNIAGADILLERCQAERRGWEWHYLNGLNHSELMTLETPGVPSVVSVAYSPNGKQFAISLCNPYRTDALGRNPNELVIVDADSGEVLRSIPQPHDNPVPKVAFSPDGHLLASGSQDSTAKIFDAATGKTVATCRGHGGPVTAVAFSPDGTRLATASHDATVREWDVRTGRELHSPYRHEYAVYSVAYMPKGNYLVSAGWGGVQLWDTASHQVVRRFSPGYAQLSCSSDSRRFAVVASGSIKVWDAETGNLLQSFSGYEGDALAAEFSPDGRFIATAGSDRTVHLWNVQTGAEEASFRGHTGRVECLSFHPSSRFLLSGSAQPAEVKLWDLTRRQEYDTVADGLEQRSALAVDGDRIYSLNTDKGGAWLRISEVATGRLLVDAMYPIDAEWQVPSRRAVLSPDGGRMAAVTEADKRIVGLWDTKTGKQIGKFGPLTGRVYHVDYSRDGRRLATAGWLDGRRQIVVWDVASGQKLDDAEVAARGGLLGAVALSDDGKFVAFDELDNALRVHVRDVDGHQILRTFAGLERPIVSLTFGHRKPYLAAGDMEGLIQLWDVATGQSLHTNPLVAEMPQYQLAFSPNDARLASVDREKVKVWDPISGREVLLLRGAPARPSDNGFNPQIAWSTDGKKLAATNWTASLSVWDSSDRAAPAAKAQMRTAADGRAFAWHLQGFSDGWLQHAPSTQEFHMKALNALQPATAAQWFERAKMNVLTGSIDKGKNDYAKAVEQAANSDAFLSEWALSLVQHGRASEAIALYRRAIDSGSPVAFNDWCYCASLELHAGDAEGYRQLCRRMVDKQKEWKNTEVDSWLVRVFTLSEDSPIPAAQALALARNGADRLKGAGTLHGLGMAYLRAGQLQEAEQRLKESAHAEPGWAGGALNGFALALVYHRQGKMEESRKVLELADQAYDRITNGHPDPAWLPPDFNPIDGVELQLLHRETEGIRKGIRR